MNTYIHGLLDYMMGILLILLPYILSFPNGAPTTVLVVVGISTIFYSLITKYEWGIIKIIPMNVHLIIDILAGLFLVVTPWVFDFSNILKWPFILLGAVEIIIAMITLGTPPKPYHR